MQVFKYKEDRIPVLLFLLYFSLDLVVYFNATSVWFLILWMGIGIIPKGWMCAWNHHHQHVNIFRVAPLNRLTRDLLRIPDRITGYAWMLHHVVGHHLNYLDQELDESRWRTPDGRVMGELEYTVMTALTAYPRALEVSRKHRKYRGPFLAMAALQLTLLAALFYFNWVNALFVFLIPMIISLNMTTWGTFYHHVGIDTDSHFEASNNILNKWYNVATGNLGYHTAHHYRQGVHWSKLPQLHSEIKHRIPSARYQDAGPPFNWLKIDAVDESEREEAERPEPRVGGGVG